MSSEHLTTERLNEYLTRKLKPGDLLLADRHLQGCTECRGYLADLRPMQEAAAILSQTSEWDADPEVHLSYGELEGLADGTIDDVAREIAEVHTADCLACREQLADLRELRDSLEMPIPVEAAAAGGYGLWDRIAGAFTFRNVLAAAAGIAILGFGIWLISRQAGPAPPETAAVNDSVTAGDLPLPTGSDANSEQVAIPDESSEADAKAVVSLVDGPMKIELDAEGNVKGIDGERFRARVKDVLTSHDVRVSPAARQLRSATGVLMSGESAGAPFSLVTPVGRVIASDRPEFKWGKLAEAETYIVAVFDENFNKVAESPAIKGTSWTPSTRLKRGAVYNWQVTAVKDGQEIKSPVRPAPDAKFRIIDAAAAADIEAARRTGSHLVLGMTYANAGMTAEAEQEFQALLRQNPGSPLARKLLRQVQSQK